MPSFKTVVMGRERTIRIPAGFIATSSLAFIVTAVLVMFMFEYGDSALSTFGFSLFIACATHVIYTIYALHAALALGASTPPITVGM